MGYTQLGYLTYALAKLANSQEEHVLDDLCEDRTQVFEQKEGDS